MAAKEAPKFVDTVLNWAKWGAIGFLGVWSLMATGIMPLAAINSALNFALNGAYYGAIGGGIIGAFREMGSLLKPAEPKKA